MSPSRISNQPAPNAYWRPLKVSQPSCGLSVMFPAITSATAEARSNHAIALHSTSQEAR